MNIINLCGIALITVSAVTVLKKSQPEMAFLVSLGGGILLLIGAVRGTAVCVEEMTGMLSGEQTAKYGPVLLKGLGIAVAVEMTADVCRDAGENGAANRLELCGKVGILILSLPLIRELLTLVGQLLQ